MIETAIALHRQGRLAEADQAYRSILLRQPNHFEALHSLGVLRLQQGNALEAVTLISRAVEARPQAFDALCNLTSALMTLNRSEEALAISERVLTARPRDAEMLFSRGVALMQLRRYPEALASFERALTEQPHHIKALFNRGTLLASLERHAEALACYDRVLALNPGVFQAQQNRGNVLIKLGRCEDALAAYESVLARVPHNLDAQNGRVIALRELGRHDEALACCEQIIKANPNYVPALISRGNLLLKLDRAEAALADFEKVIGLWPDDAEARNNRGLALYALDRHLDALTSYDEAIAREPLHWGALNNRGVVLHKLERLEEALAAFDRALAVYPDYRDALVNRGEVLKVLDRAGEALASYERALALKADDVDVLYKSALLLAGQQDFHNALACYEQMLMLAPESVEAHIGKGSILGHFGQHEESLLVFERALSIRPDDTDLLGRRAYAHARLQRYDEARVGYERVLALDPGNLHILGELASCYASICDWEGGARIVEEIGQSVTDGIISPFVLLGLPISTAALSECTTRFVKLNVPKREPLVRERSVPDSGRIRIAYLSADFRRHATSYLAAGLFEQHDRSRFEVIGVSFGPDDGSEMRARVRGSFDQFHDVYSAGDREGAQLLQELGVDIAVDLMGHTKLGRPGLLAYRPAPIQVAYLGYPGPTGEDFIDYLIADRIVLPPEQQSLYPENVVRLPDSYQVNDSKRPIAERAPSRSDMGLPENAFVFCSFNQIWKFNKPVFDIWMRLMRAVEGSVLWLIKSNDLAHANLRKYAQAHGVDPQRLVFAPNCEQSVHLARLQLADLILDTLPCNAHTTASDALWVGVPLVTCMGETFAGRVAASVLHAVGLPELVTDNLEDYEALALKLGTDRALLAAVNSKLARNRLTHPLFDTARFARHIEAAYTIMWERWQRGEPPKAFDVDPIER